MVFNTPTSDVANYSHAEKLTARADGFYMQFTLRGNESAIALYEQAIADEPSFAPAQAGLANALVQRVVRWPAMLQSSKDGVTSLGAALDVGLTETPEAREVLERAHALAERSVRIAPNDASALKALGFVDSARGDFSAAIKAYQKAVISDSDAWIPLVNLGELYQLQGDRKNSIDYFEQAYAVMERVYDSEPQRIGSRHAPLGVAIAQAYEASGAPQEAEIWYQRVLAYAPLEPVATAGLAGVLAVSGDIAEARRLCSRLVAKTGLYSGCDKLLEEVE